jgi:hypothetical protein
MIGLALEKFWARWLALAGAVAVLPWAIVLTFGLPGGAPLMQQIIALVASLVLLMSLPGRAMFERYEGKAKMDWSGPRMGLVRWTIILNIASALGLSLFVALYRYTIEWHVAIPAVLLLGLVVGVLLLGFQKTIGLLLVAVSCVLFVPAGTYFVWKEASYTGEVYLFAASFLPACSRSGSRFGTHCGRGEGESLQLDARKDHCKAASYQLSVSAMPTQRTDS